MTRPYPRPYPRLLLEIGTLFDGFLYYVNLILTAVMAGVGVYIVLTWESHPPVQSGEIQAQWHTENSMLNNINSFCAETDPDRPVIGSRVVHEGIAYVVAEVDWTTQSKLVEEKLFNFPEAMPLIMAPRGHDLVLARSHCERPFITWLVFLTKE